MNGANEVRGQARLPDCQLQAGKGTPELKIDHVQKLYKTALRSSRQTCRLVFSGLIHVDSIDPTLPNSSILFNFLRVKYSLLRLE